MNDSPLYSNALRHITAQYEDALADRRLTVEISTVTLGHALAAAGKPLTASGAHEFMRTLEPARTADERGNPGLLYTAQNIVDAFKAGCIGTRSMKTPKAEA